MGPDAPEGPSDQVVKMKRASIAAQCYVLCVKLLACLSERMLQSLLALPMPATHPRPGRATPRERAEPAGSQLPHSGTTTPSRAIPESLRLADLVAPPTDPFGHALSASTNVLDVGGGKVGRMELLLRIPAEQGVGTSLASEATSRATLGSANALQSSLTARLVAAMWEDEAAIECKAPVTYFRRCHAAIAGLSTNGS